MRVNMNKTKVMISGERQMVWQKAARWPCGVCNKGVGSNSLQYTRCQKWVHKKCSGIKGSMSKVAKSFICRGCLNPISTPNMVRNGMCRHNYAVERELVGCSGQPHYCYRPYYPTARFRSPSSYMAFDELFPGKSRAMSC